MPLGLQERLVQVLQEKVLLSEGAISGRPWTLNPRGDQRQHRTRFVGAETARRFVLPPQCISGQRGLAHRAKLDGNAKLDKFAHTLEKVCVDTVEAGFMTKDLALLVGPEQKWLTTEGFLDKVDENLKKAMA